jgi:DHA1 family multidrug resistance protein-like MFS transporter
LTSRNRYALWALFAATAAVRIGFGAVIPVLPIYVHQHGLNTFMIALMTNAYMIAVALFQSYAGHLGDRLGRRPVMLAGTWLYTAAAALFMIDAGPWYYVLLRGLEGMGAAAFGPASRAFLADLVPESERGKAYGQLMSWDMAGILLGPMLGGVAQSIGGLRAPFAFCALLGLVAGVPLLFFAPKGRVGAAAAVEGERINIPAGRLVRSPAFWAVALPGIGFSYLNGLYSVIWSLYMQAHGATTWEINLNFTLFSVPMVLFMGYFGKLADRVGRPLLIGLGGLGSTITTFLYGVFPSPWALNGLCMLDGVSSSMFSPASQAFMAEVAPPAIRGKFMGLVGTSQTIATIIVVFGIGWLYEHVATIWLFALGALSLAFGCGSAVVIMLRRPAAGLRRELELAGD